MSDHLNLLSQLIHVSLGLCSHLSLDVASLLCLLSGDPALSLVRLDMILAVYVSGVDTGLADSVLNSLVDLVLFGLLNSYRELFLLNLFSYVICIQCDRRHSGYLHRDTVNGLILSTCVSCHQRRELVAQVVVSIYYRCLEACIVSQLHLLTRYAGALGNDLCYGEVTDLQSSQLVLGLHFVIHCSVQDQLNHTYEVFVLSHEVGLALHAYDSAEAVFSFCQNATLGSLTVATLCSDCLTTLAEQVLSYLKISVSLFQSLLHVHHTGTGDVTQFLNIC